MTNLDYQQPQSIRASRADKSSGRLTHSLLDYLDEARRAFLTDGSGVEDVRLLHIGRP